MESRKFRLHDGRRGVALAVRVTPRASRNEITEIQMTKYFELLIAQNVLLRVHLQTPGLVAHVNEHALTHVPVSGDPPGNSNLAPFHVVGARPSTTIAGFEMVPEGIDTARPQSCQLGFSLVD